MEARLLRTFTSLSYSISRKVASPMRATAAAGDPSCSPSATSKSSRSWLFFSRSLCKDVDAYSPTRDSLSHISSSPACSSHRSSYPASQPQSSTSIPVEELPLAKLPVSLSHKPRSSKGGSTRRSLLSSSSSQSVVTRRVSTHQRHHDSDSERRQYQDLERQHFHEEKSRRQYQELERQHFQELEEKSRRQYQGHERQHFQEAEKSKGRKEQSEAQQQTPPTASLAAPSTKKSVASAAVGYALALADLSNSTGSLERVSEDAANLLQLLENEELFEVLTSSAIIESKKKSILSTIAKDVQFHECTSTFLEALVERRRIVLIKDILKEFQKIHDDLTDTQAATVTSAVKLDSSQLTAVAKKIKSMTRATNVRVKNDVDPSLIAGYVITFEKNGSRYIDMSVKGQVDRLAPQSDHPRLLGGTSQLTNWYCS